MAKIDCEAASSSLAVPSASSDVNATPTATVTKLSNVPNVSSTLVSAPHAAPAHRQSHVTASFATPINRAPVVSQFARTSTTIAPIIASNFYPPGQRSQSTTIMPRQVVTNVVQASVASTVPSASTRFAMLSPLDDDCMTTVVSQSHSASMLHKAASFSGVVPTTYTRLSSPYVVQRTVNSTYVSHFILNRIV